MSSHFSLFDILRLCFFELSSCLFTFTLFYIFFCFFFSLSLFLFTFSHFTVPFFLSHSFYVPFFLPLLVSLSFFPRCFTCPFFFPLFVTSLCSLPPCVYFCCFLSPFSVKQRIVRGTDHGRKSVASHMDESDAVQMCWRVAWLPLRRAEAWRQTSLDFSNGKPRPPTRMTAPGSSQEPAGKLQTSVHWPASEVSWKIGEAAATSTELWTSASRISSGRTWLETIELSAVSGPAPCLLPRKGPSRSSLFRFQEHCLRS